MCITKYKSEGEWKAEGRRLFGDDIMKWRFVCPICGHVATPQDWVTAGGDKARNMIAFSCIGRLTINPKKAFGNDKRKKGPCDYAGGGLFTVNPIQVGARKDRVFAFASPDPALQPAAKDSRK